MQSWQHLGTGYSSKELLSITKIGRQSGPNFPDLIEAEQDGDFVPLEPDLDPDFPGQRPGALLCVSILEPGEFFLGPYQAPVWLIVKLLDGPPPPALEDLLNQHPIIAATDGCRRRHLPKCHSIQQGNQPRVVAKEVVRALLDTVVVGHRSLVRPQHPRFAGALAQVLAYVQHGLVRLPYFQQEATRGVAEMGYWPGLAGSVHCTHRLGRIPEVIGEDHQLRVRALVGGFDRPGPGALAGLGEKEPLIEQSKLVHINNFQFHSLSTISKRAVACCDLGKHLAPKLVEAAVEVILPPEDQRPHILLRGTLDYPGGIPGQLPELLRIGPIGLHIPQVVVEVDGCDGLQRGVLAVESPVQQAHLQDVLAGEEVQPRQVQVDRVQRQERALVVVGQQEVGPVQQRRFGRQDVRRVQLRGTAPAPWVYQLDQVVDVKGLSLAVLGRHEQSSGACLLDLLVVEVVRKLVFHGDIQQKDRHIEGLILPKLVANSGHGVHNGRPPPLIVLGSVVCGDGPQRWHKLYDASLARLQISIVVPEVDDLCVVGDLLPCQVLQPSVDVQAGRLLLLPAHRLLVLKTEGFLGGGGRRRGDRLPRGERLVAGVLRFRGLFGLGAGGLASASVAHNGAA